MKLLSRKYQLRGSARRDTLTSSYSTHHSPSWDNVAQNISWHRTFHGAELSTAQNFPQDRTFHGTELSTAQNFPRHRAFHGTELCTAQNFPRNRTFHGTVHDGTERSAVNYSTKPAAAHTVRAQHIDQASSLDCSAVFLVADCSCALPAMGHT